MDRARASSSECNKTCTDKYETHPITFNQNNCGRSRIHPLICNPRDLSDDSTSLDYYYGRDCNRPMVSNSELREQLDFLQDTVNKMLNMGGFDQIGSSCPSMNISEALKHEYNQMMNALKELEGILSVKRNNAESVTFTNTSVGNEPNIHQLQREIFYRDTLIKCLSDRLKILCKANDKLIIDYENQENMLSEELCTLKRQLEKAKEVMRALTMIKKRPNIGSNQEMDNEIYYLRESVCTKEMMIADLKHRNERLNRENNDLKCKFDNQDDKFDRDMSYLKNLNEQMKEQIDTLNDSLELKDGLINDLQNQLDNINHSDLTRSLRNQLGIITNENELHKEELLEQTELLQTFRDQLRILTETSQFKDETIIELKCCLRQFTDINDSISEGRNYGNDIELFKEYLTNDINLKNKIDHFLVNNTADNIESITRLHNHLNTLLATDMDDGFNNNLREYLHQCYLSDDYLRLVVEYLVKSMTIVKVTSIDRETTASCLPDIQTMGKEIRTLSGTYHEDKNQFDKDKERMAKELSDFQQKLNDFQIVSERLTNDNATKDKEINYLKQEHGTYLATIKELQFINTESQQCINRLQKELRDQVTEKNILSGSLTSIEQEKCQEVAALQSKLSNEIRNCLSLKEENQRLLEKLTCLCNEKSNLELECKEINFRCSEMENSKSLMIQSDLNNLQMVNKSLEIKGKSLASENSLLDCQVQKLTKLLEEHIRQCIENHIDKTSHRHESEDSENCKQKMNDLENVLALMSDELNEKVHSLVEIRKMIKNQPLLSIDSECDQMDPTHISKHLLSQKESEISYLKSKLGEIQIRESQENIPTQSHKHDILPQLRNTISDLETKVDRLNQQLTDRSNTIAQLQKLLKEKDNVIENAGKMIKIKNDSIIETEKFMSLVSHQNMNIKEELSVSHGGNGEIQMFKLSNNNLREEMQRLQGENERLKDAMRNAIKTDQTNKYKSQSVDLLPQNPVAVKIRDNSVEQINQEIKKLYVNFEDKNNELKEYSLKEIKSRDRKLENINFELKLKTDQMQKILIENRRLSDKVNDESQQISQYQQNSLLKEQLLEKLLKEKDKIRSIFLTELREKNEQLTENAKIVYFLNAELHRLSTDFDIVNAELNSVKTSENFSVTQTQTLKITQAELGSLKDENTSLRLCVNLKMAEAEAMKQELTIQRTGSKQLSNDISLLKLQIFEKDVQFNMKLEENGAMTRTLSSVENETQTTIEYLKMQLLKIKEDFGNMSEIKEKLERAVRDLNDENVSLKQIKEELQQEKRNCRDEIENLREKIDLLTRNLFEYKEYVDKLSGKVDRGQQMDQKKNDNGIVMNEKWNHLKSDEFNQTLQQLDELTNENMEFKTEIERLRNIIIILEDQGKDNLERIEEDSRIIKEMERTILSAGTNNGTLITEMEQFQQLNKSQREINAIENKDQTAFRFMKEESLKHDQLQEMLDKVTHQLFVVEEKWLNKYGQLKDSYEKLECDYLQQKHQYETVRQDYQILDSTAKSQCQDWNCLSNKNEQLLDNCSRLECEINSLELYNTQMSAQIETLTTDLVAAHSQIWNITSKLNEKESTIGELCSRLNNKLTSHRRYGSQPVLNRFDMCGPDFDDPERRDYNDLKTRYNALCNQVDNMACQLRKKEKRISDLENNDQLKCDYHDLERRYQRMLADCSTVNQQYRYSSQEHLDIQGQACTDELQETIQSQNQELNQLKSSHQMLANDYEMCCERLRHLEKQILHANSELGNWPNTSHNRTANVEQLKAELNDLRLQNEKLSFERNEKNELKKECIDTSNRLVEVMNCNMNLEKQVVTFRQKSINQNRTIEDLKAQLNHLEKIEEDNGYGLLKEEHGVLQHEYRVQLLNIEQLSAQLFDHRDLVERLTIENRHLVAKVNENEYKISQLLETIEKFDDYSQDKSKEGEESRLRNELAIGYDMIDRLKQENEELGKEKYSNECQLHEYDKALEISCEEIKMLKAEIDRRTSVSVAELNKLKDTSLKLSGELSYLQDKFLLSQKSRGTQTLSESNEIGLLSISPAIEVIRPHSEKEINDRSHGSDLTYSSSKSVTWKTTHTDRRTSTDDNVTALQRAIDDYNNLVTDIVVPRKLVSSTSNEGPKTTSSTQQYTVVMEQAKDRRPENEESEIIFVEIESDLPRVASNRQNMVVESAVEVSTIHGIDSPRFYDILELLKNCNIDVDFDGNNESPEMYLNRVMNRYKELEQFFLATMKIQFNQPLDEDTINLFDNFNDNLKRQFIVLNGQCLQLNDVLTANVTEPSPNTEEEVTGLQLTTVDYRQLLHIVKTEQQQLAALNVVFKNLTQAQPFVGAMTSEVNHTHLASPYELILQSLDASSANCRPGTDTVSQLPIATKILAKPLTELHSPEIAIRQSQQDSIVKSFHKKSKQSFGEVTKSMTTELKAPESMTNDIEDESHARKFLNKTGVNSASFKTHSNPEEMHVGESLVHFIENDSYLQKIPNKNTLKGSVETISAKNNEVTQVPYIPSQTAESVILSVFDDPLQTIVNKDNLDNTIKVINTKGKLNNVDQTENKSVTVQAPESKVFNEGSVEHIFNNDANVTDSLKQSSITKRLHNEVAVEGVLPLENVQHKTSDNRNIESGLKSVETPEILALKDSITDTLKALSSANSGKFNVANERLIEEIDDDVKMDLNVHIEQKSVPIMIKDKMTNQKDGPLYSQTVSEGLSIKEEKTKPMGKLEDSLSYASIGHFEKAMHQLNDIDFDNLDLSIDIKTKINIYVAEIDYLNDKNLFHSYAINVLTDPSRYLYNNSFLEHINASLTKKAKHIRLLQTQFNFDLHLSEKERALLSKVFDSDYIYKQQFDNWLDLQRKLQLTSANQLEDLKSQLEQCEITKDIQKEKEALKLQLQEMNRIIEENNNLKAQLKLLLSKSDNVLSSGIGGKPSKIPLLKVSSMDIPIINVTKSASTLSQTNNDKHVQTQSEGGTTTAVTKDQLVSPNEVRLAIAGEISIENLRSFANLLAEDNFDLAAEIEKLLTTIEELRRQSEDNCNILSETVEMLQNSETFVNDLEKKLSLETKKTQVISSRVDKLNELNKQVVLELHRILKDTAPPAASNMDIEERSQYLLDCLRILETENKMLHESNKKLEKQLNIKEPNTPFSFLNKKLPSPIDFYFETTMLPNGSLVGSINFAYSDDVSKTLALTFNVQSATENLDVSDGSNVTRFLIEREPAFVGKKSPNETSVQLKNLNNSCCYRNHSRCSHSSRLCYIQSLFDSISCRPIETRQSRDSQITNGFGDNCQIKKKDNHSLTENKRMESNSTVNSDITLPIIDDDTTTSSTLKNMSCENSSAAYSLLSTTRSSSSSITTDRGHKNYFINFRTPIYFRKLRESHY